MIELAFVTCLLAQPQVCAPHSLLFEDGLGIAGCLRTGPMELARWTDEHPGQRVVRYSCRHPGAKETRMSPEPLTSSGSVRA